MECLSCSSFVAIDLAYTLFPPVACFTTDTYHSFSLSLSFTAHHLVHNKQHSPSHRSTNLRVVIPSNPSSSNLTSDDISYTEVSPHTLSTFSWQTLKSCLQHNRQTSTLNTPVVALQTPIVSGLSNYPVSTFGAQDFSMTSSDLNMITSWNSSHQSLSATLQQHNR